MRRLDRIEFSRPTPWPVLRWTLPFSLLCVLAGYFGPWVWHRAAGLVILGFDLAEYVKFLAEVRSGAVGMWREWFILPAIALSISLTLIAANRNLQIRWYVALPLLLLSVWAALSALPPAWTPALLMTPEFIKQTVIIAVCLGLLIVSPLLRRLPALFVGWLVALLHVGTAAGAIWQFIAIKPAIDRVYGAFQPYGWGFYLYAGGVILAFLSVIVATLRHGAPRL
jgi:hypothetical protein